MAFQRLPFSFPRFVLLFMFLSFHIHSVCVVKHNFIFTHAYFPNVFFAVFLLPNFLTLFVPDKDLI
jgi:hypothetical protein